MTNTQYRHIRNAKSHLRELYLHFSPTCHYSLMQIADRKSKIISEVSDRVPQYATYGLHEYAEAYHEQFTRDHLVQVYVTPIGKLEVGSDEYNKYIDKVGPKGFCEQDNPLETVYRDDYNSVYFASVEGGTK